MGPPWDELWLGNRGCEMPIGLLTGKAGPPLCCDRWRWGQGVAGSRGFLQSRKRENLLVLWQVTETNEKGWKRLLH